MQGILKSNHQKLCDCLQDIKDIYPLQDNKLNELEEELRSVFTRYQQKMNELKLLIQLYEEKEKSLRNEIKKTRKYSSMVSKKMTSLALSKATIVIILLVQKSFFSMEAGAGFAAIFY